MVFDSNYILASLDVVFLFTNVPVDLALNSIEKRWIYIFTKTNISKEEFVTAVKFILNSTFFTLLIISFTNKFLVLQWVHLYLLSLLTVMQNLEEIAIRIYKYSHYFITDMSMTSFSHFHLNTLTILLLFLILYIQSYNLLWRLARTIDWIFLTSFWLLTIKKLFSIYYHKTTFSGRFLNFHSNLFIPLCHKRGIIISFVDKIFLLLYPRFQHNNLVEASYFS